MEQMTAPLSLSCPLDGSGGFCVLPASKGLGPWPLFKVATPVHSQCKGEGSGRKRQVGHLGYRCIRLSAPTESQPPSLLLPIRIDSPAVMVSPLHTCCSLVVRTPKAPGSSHTCCVLWQEHTPLGDQVLQPSLAENCRVKKHKIPGGSLGAIPCTAASACTPWFLDLCTLHNHMEVSSVMSIPHHEGRCPILSVFPR